jgi:arabinogalactan endo-1,4-beta-galactosidase
MKTSLISLFIILALSVQGNIPDNVKIQSKYAAATSVESGKPVGIVLTAYKTTMIANGKDETIIRVFVVDSAGREIRTAEVPIQISVNGDAKITGTKNGIPVEFKKTEERTSLWESKIVKGSCQLIFQAGTNVDKIKVVIKAENIRQAAHEIHTIPADVKLLKPTAAQLAYAARRTDRSIGADISFVPQREATGMKFMENGSEKDVVDILKNNGLNYIRLRLFVNPENEKGYSPVKGFCGLEYTKQMALRVKKAGMKILLNFHYSDYWADPQQQNKPLAWKDLDFKTLKDSLKGYTKRVLLELKEQGTLPEMVQVGNEINHGMLWPDGHIGNLDNLAELLKAGADGIKEVDPSIIVMMHIALGGQNDESVFWLDNMIARGVQFDIIGLSYYPQYHGTLDDLVFNTNDLIKRYNKDINVVEYSTLKNEIHEIVFGLPDNRGEGTFIWEPLNRFFSRNTREITDDLKGYNDLNKKYLGGQ